MQTKKSDTPENTLDENPLFELFHDELKDIYWAEKHLTKALPKMIKKACAEELVGALENHLEETRHQVERLDKVFSMIGKKALAKKCDAMEGITKEGEELMEDFKDSPALDAAIIAAGQKVEHYEIASYGTLVAYANRLGLEDASQLLKETLEEEGAADKKLTEIAESVANEDAETVSN